MSPCTDLTQPINRTEAVKIIAECEKAAEIVRACIERAQGNGHDDAPDYLDEALDLISSATDSINTELDSARSKAA